MKQIIKINEISVYFWNVRQSSNMTNKGIAEFWKTIKAFLTSKGWLKNRDIMPMNNEEMVVTDDKKLARSFNEHYANIFERSSGLKPEKIELDDPINTDKKI